MKRILLIGLLTLVAKIASAQTEAEQAFMKSIEDTLQCSCHSCGGFGTAQLNEDLSRTDSAQARLTFYDMNKSVVMRGCFYNNKLMCGIQCIYNAQKRLELVYIYRNGVLVGTAVMPK